MSAHRAVGGCQCPAVRHLGKGCAQRIRPVDPCVSMLLPTLDAQLHRPPALPSLDMNEAEPAMQHDHAAVVHLGTDHAELIDLSTECVLPVLSRQRVQPVCPVLGEHEQLLKHGPGHVYGGGELPLARQANISGLIHNSVGSLTVKAAICCPAVE